MLFDSSLRKELARSFGATLIVLVTVVMTITLIRTLGQASRGSFNPSDVMLVMGYNVLTFLPNILTMGLFIAVVSTLSRGYADSEMVIWFSSGVGIASFLRPLFRFAWPLLLAVAMLSLLVLPWANQQIEGLRTQYENRGDLDRVQPGQFQESADGTRVFFVEKSQPNQTTVTNVFVATTGQGKETITMAHQGHTEVVGEDRFLVLDRGQRLEYALNKSDIKLSEFTVYRLQVGQDTLSNPLETPLNNRNTLDLLRDGSASSQGELAWRIGFVLAAFNLLVIALAATRVNPRVGRTGNLVFSLLLFQVYLNLLTLGQNWIATKSVGFVVFNLSLHGGAFVLAMLWVTKVHFNWNWRNLLPRSVAAKGMPNS